MVERKRLLEADPNLQTLMRKPANISYGRRKSVSLFPLSKVLPTQENG